MSNARAQVELDELIRLRFDQRRFSFLPKQPINGLLSGRHASRLRGRGLTFEELRRYHPGDDVRTIDWRATARLKKTHVRVYSEERERTVLFVVDQRVAMHFGSRRATKAVAAAEFAALGAWRVLDMGDRVGALIFGDAETAYVPPRRGLASVHRVCGELARMNQQLDANAPKGNPDALNEALERADRLAPHDALVVLATDCDGANAETHRILSRIAARNDALAALGG